MTAREGISPSSFRRRRPRLGRARRGRLPRGPLLFGALLVLAFVALRQGLQTSSLGSKSKSESKSQAGSAMGPRPLGSTQRASPGGRLPSTHAPAPKDGYGYRRFASMGTWVDVEAPAADLAKVVYLTLRAFEGVEALASGWRASSALSRLNQAAGRGPQVVPDALWDLLSRAVALGGLTQGAFDISWAVLRPLWDFRRGVVPSAAALRQARRYIDYRRITLSGRPGQGVVTLPAHMALGLGGIAKGFALDQVAKALAAAGLRSYSISAGGQVLVAGGRGHRAWRVGIRDPIRGAKSFFAVATMRAGSCATSGDYERAFDRDGVHYHHILDPRTGRPTRGLHSVTVIDRDATRADALATALMVMGRRKGLALIARLPKTEALFVDTAGQVYPSAGAKAVLRILRAPRLPKRPRRRPS